MNSPFGFGALERTKDRRDFKLGLSQAPIQRPLVFMPDVSEFPVKMQGKYGTCGGHAGAAMESFLEMLDLSPKYLWKQVKKLYSQTTNVPVNEDSGVDMRTIFKALQQTGVCHETLCPDILDDTFGQYSDSSTITDAMLNDAYPQGITNYAFIDNPSLEQIKQAIYQNKAVLARVDCGDGWWINGWSESATCPLKLGNYASGHFVVLWGYDTQYIYFRNSWSSDWGRKGDGYFDASYVSHVTEIGTAIAGPSVKQQIVTLYQKLIYTLQQLLSSLKPKQA